MDKIVRVGGYASSHLDHYHAVRRSAFSRDDIFLSVAADLHY
jgi:hypothetical protein